MKHILKALLIALTISGCDGGGGNDSGNSTDSGNGNTATPFDQIIIPDGFNMRSSYPVMLDITLTTNEAMYLSVYGNHTTGQDGEPIADTSSRIIAGQIKNGRFKGKFTATSTLENILIEAWYLDGSRLPFREVISLPQETITIQN